MEFPGKGDRPLDGGEPIIDTVLDEMPTAAAVVKFSEQRITGVAALELRERITEGTSLIKTGKQLDDYEQKHRAEAVVIGEEFDDQDPAERVEHFLSLTAEHFAIAKQTWRAARQTLIELKRLPKPSPEEVRSFGNRERRRDPKYRPFLEGGFDKLIADVQTDAKVRMTEAQNVANGVTPEDSYTVVGIQQYIRSSLEEKPYYNVGRLDSDETFTNQIKTTFQKINHLRDLTVEGYFLDLTLGRTLENFWQDPEVIEPFVARISEMLSDEQASQEFPGLLEALANHVHKLGNRSPLAIAFKQHVRDPSTKAKEFMVAALEGRAGIKQDRVRQQLEAAVYATRLFVDQQDDAWLTTAAERWASRHEDWEDWHKAELEQYITRERTEVWNEFARALSSHFNSGRLAGLSISGNKQVKLGQTVKPDKKIAAELEQVAIEPEIKQEPERITQFALLERAGTGSRTSSEAFTMVDIGSVKAILDSKPFASYLANFKEKGMREHFERALQHLTTNWFDHKTTRRLTSGRYETDETSPRNARRLSLRTFTGVPRGSMASQTRIIYDVIKVNGKNSLVIRGPFNKADIENLSQMP